MHSLPQCSGYGANVVVKTSVRFAVLPEFDGVGFSVGRTFPGVTGCFAAPRDVRKWLAQISRLEAVATP